VVIVLSSMSDLMHGVHETRSHARGGSETTLDKTYGVLGS